ncbi:hypothetical protein J1N35_024569 [Gossypium stocksii]|uniref:Uncharacterized protein n=1 Tax=Gossypium stocksii TaxID=47602 RepID=A0A9D3ZWV0_9ROSI|nr:hypothetical protein J1N35_024569 [Gossypium stocksii]
MVQHPSVCEIKLPNFAFDFEIVEGEKRLNDTKEGLLLPLHMLEASFHIPLHPFFYTGTTGPFDVQNVNFNSLSNVIDADLCFYTFPPSGKKREYFVEEWKMSKKLFLSVDLAEPAKERIANIVKSITEGHKDLEDTATTMEVTTIEN